MLKAMSSLIELLAGKGVKRSFRKGVTLIQEGESGDEIFIILSGSVRAFSNDVKGKEITHGVYGAGEYVGEMSLDGGLRSANVEAIQATSCSVVTRQTLCIFIQEYPDFALELISKLIHRIRMATANSTSVALSNVYGRLVKFLNDLANSQADPHDFIEQKISHQQIANHLGCSREMVSRLMKDLEKGGYILTSSKKVRIEKPLPKNW
jgi:CRP/FNR family transcriptional regulator, cyclic AMP receptor protein